ncbi:MAG: DUF4268 domain-containing protein [Crocinitomicaceae bacterium]|jgi:hypothetical protein|tara:strand:- start:16830 stop:17294 length:465 start_codon:yes stop_codon:yes gene_type:complete
MYSKEEKRDLNIQFWDGFNEYMKKSKSSASRRLNWLSYPTNVKDTYLRLHCNDATSALRFDIQFKDKDIRVIFWEQLQELKSLLTSHVNSPSDWIEQLEDSEGRTISRIQWESSEWSLYQKNDWKKIYKFFKDRLIEFDHFYQEYKEILINLIK